MQLLQQAFVLELTEKMQHSASRWHDGLQLVRDEDLTVNGQAGTQGGVTVHTRRFNERLTALLYGFLHSAKCSKKFPQQTLSLVCRNYQTYRRSDTYCAWLYSTPDNLAPGNFEKQKARSNAKICEGTSLQSLFCRRGLIFTVYKR